MGDRLHQQIETAIISGDVERVQTLYDANPMAFSHASLMLAADLGKWNIVTFLTIHGGSHMGTNMDAPWPASVVHIDMNIDAHKFPFEEIEGRCNCEIVCKYGCENYSSRVLCHDDNCSAGEVCGNRFRPELLTTRFNSDHGIGLRANSLIREGQFIIEYVGRFTANPHGRYTAAVKGSKKIFIDAETAGNDSRFINHSCLGYNCEMIEYAFRNTRRLGIFAIEDIPPGEELLFRYNDRSKLPFECTCGSC